MTKLKCNEDGPCDAMVEITRPYTTPGFKKIIRVDPDDLSNSCHGVAYCRNGRREEDKSVEFCPCCGESAWYPVRPTEKFIPFEDGMYVMRKGGDANLDNMRVCYVSCLSNTLAGPRVSFNTGKLRALADMLDEGYVFTGPLPGVSLFFRS